MYEYNICTEADEEIFNKQCKALEKYIPNLRKENLLIDVDGSKVQCYFLSSKKITVHNSYYIGAVFVKSEIDIRKYFNKNNS